MIDALLATPEVREVLDPFVGAYDLDSRKRIVQTLLTALAAQPEGETLELAANEVIAHRNRLPMNVYPAAEKIVKAIAPILTAKLHARVATLEAENKKRVDALFESGNEFLDRLRAVEAERDTLRGYASHKVDCNEYHSNTWAWGKGCTCGLAALTGGGR